MSGTLLKTTASAERLRATVEQVAASLKLDFDPIDEQAFKAHRGTWLKFFFGGLWADFRVTFASPLDGTQNVLFQLNYPKWARRSSYWGGALGEARMKQLFADFMADVEDVLRSSCFAVERSAIVVDFVPAVANLQELQVRHYFESNK